MIAITLHLGMRRVTFIREGNRAVATGQYEGSTPYIDSSRPGVVLYDTWRETGLIYRRLSPEDAERVEAFWKGPTCERCGKPVPVTSLYGDGQGRIWCGPCDAIVKG